MKIVKKLKFKSPPRQVQFHQPIEIDVVTHVDCLSEIVVENFRLQAIVIPNVCEIDVKHFYCNFMSDLSTAQSKRATH